MKTKALMKLLQRQVDIVDMVIKCNNAISNNEVELRRIAATTDQKEKWWLEFMQAEKNCNAAILKYQRIKQRLIRYYLDVQDRIVAMSPTIEINHTEAAHINSLTNNIS